LFFFLLFFLFYNLFFSLRLRNWLHHRRLHRLLYRWLNGVNCRLLRYRNLLNGWLNRLLLNRLMKRLTTGSAMQVTYTMHDPFPSMGSITVEGDHLAFSDCKWLGRALEFASNVEVYPLSNGGVRMVLTFHGLVKRA